MPQGPKNLDGSDYYFVLCIQNQDYLNFPTKFGIEFFSKKHVLTTKNQLELDNEVLILIMI